MTAVPDETDRQLADDVLPAEVEDLAVPVPLDRLFPWHKPRKQLVREEQWLRFSRRLIQDERGGPGLRELAGTVPEVHYLTLPGIDYLDVRQLGGLCAELGCRLTSTGFQAGNESNPWVARAKVREQQLIDAGHITGGSHTYSRRIEDIIPVGGQAYEDLRGRGPFHIVNVDACGSVAPPTAEHAHRLIEAMYRIVELQLDTRAGRWLLFVSADVRPDSIHGDTLDALCNAIFTNAESDEEFGNVATPLFDTGEGDIRSAAERARGGPGIEFLRLFSLGLAKWFLHLAQGRRWDMRTHEPYCYSTMPEGDDRPSMACLAFEFLPPPGGLMDPFGVVRAEPMGTPGQEDTAMLAVREIGTMANADARMREDEGLRRRTARDLRQLLEEAGYRAEVLEGIGA